MKKGRISGHFSEISVTLPNLRGSMTMLAIYICVGLYVALAVLNLLNIWVYSAAYSFLGLSWGGVTHGFIWQFFSSPFVHGGIQHMVFNMLALAFFGVDLKILLSPGKLPVQYCRKGTPKKTNFQNLTGSFSLTNSTSDKKVGVWGK